MSLYVRVFSNFYTHRKTARLRIALGNDALWVPPRLWAYAAENQPDGCFSGYTADELSMLIGYSGNASRMLQALLDVGFMDADPLSIHDWHEHNGYHRSYAERASKAAAARWNKPPSDSPDLKVPDLKGKETSNASGMLEASEKKYHKDARTVLHVLNETCGKHFRETDANLSLISQRLREPEIELDGVRAMLIRQCKRWKNTTQEEYLRPETLFGKTKFDGYYAARDKPIIAAVNGGNGTAAHAWAGKTMEQAQGQWEKDNPGRPFSAFLTDWHAFEDA